METVIRVTMIYFLILIGLRVLGKREFSQLSPLELVSLLLIPEVVAQALIREDFSMSNAVIAVTTLFCLVLGTSMLLQRSKRAEELIAGVPTVLVEHGRFIEENLNKERVTPGEIFGEMHKSGLEYLAQVKWAVLEADGKISFVPEDVRDQSKSGEPHGKEIV